MLQVSSFGSLGIYGIKVRKPYRIFKIPMLGIAMLFLCLEGRGETPHSCINSKPALISSHLYSLRSNLLHQYSQQEKSYDVDDFNHWVNSRPCGIFVRIANRITS